MRTDLFGNLAHLETSYSPSAGTLGQVSIIPETAQYDAYVILQSQMKLSIDAAKADLRFIYYCFLAARRFENSSTSELVTPALPHINLTVLRNFKVPVSSMRQQAANCRQSSPHTTT